MRSIILIGVAVLAVILVAAAVTGIVLYVRSKGGDVQSSSGNEVQSGSRCNGSNCVHKPESDTAGHESSLDDPQDVGKGALDFAKIQYRPQTNIMFAVSGCPACKEAKQVINEDPTTFVTFNVDDPVFEKLVDLYVPRTVKQAFEKHATEDGSVPLVLVYDRDKDSVVSKVVGFAKEEFMRLGASG